ncbi:MAG TPA: hypothetical protein VJH03_11855 [Blastocatellia bacterium]|nr:hypothetical protein [Blastocatellia bacterium]
MREYVRDLGIGGTADAVDDEEKSDGVGLDENDICESTAEDAFLEIDERIRACGGSLGAYPFEVIDENVLRVRRGMDKRAYSFMALLSQFGKDAGPLNSDGAKLFEELSAQAIGTYMGRSSTSRQLEKSAGDEKLDCLVRTEVFGFPRRLLPKGFADAVDSLCEKMGEGRGHCSRPKLPDQKDGRLDVVAWKEFPDRRQGKLIAFGQCATGAGWADKLTELPQTTDWCTTWMDRPAVWPIRAFFVPHRVEFQEWFHTCVHGGLLFDRCRIAYLTVDISRDLSIQLAAWSKHALRQLRGG